MAKVSDHTTNLVKLTQKAITESQQAPRPEEATRILLVTIAGSLAHIAIQLDALDAKLDKTD